MLKNQKGKKIYSVLNKKCPVCHEGDFFLDNNPYNLSKILHNHKYCSSCGHRFELDNGFFYGAMYVSYALTIAFSVAIGVAIWVLFPSSAYYIYIAAILSGLVLLMPISYTFSRMIWMNMFSKYNKNAIRDHKEKSEVKHEVNEPIEQLKTS